MGIVFDGRNDVLCIVRYVDDILICSRHFNNLNSVERPLTISSEELTFTKEAPVDGNLQFLVLSFHVSRGLCCRYNQESRKHFLNVRSCHPKGVRRGLASVLLCSALSRSCAHEKHNAVTAALGRLYVIGYSSKVLSRPYIT